MRSEHSASERDTVIRNGRVQGGLQPTRAFGDAVYKWTNAQAAQYVFNMYIYMALADTVMLKDRRRFPGTR